MATDITTDLASLRFDGKRFEGHALDVECTRELIAYRNLIVECAKELWRRKNPDRVRLPRGFEEGFRLQFNRLEDGSAVVPLQRVRVDDQSALDWGNLDEFDEAADLIDAAIAAANDDELLPPALPSNVILLFRDFGKSLGPDEVLFTRSRHGSTEAAYTAKARKRLTEWVDYWAVDFDYMQRKEIIKVPKSLGVEGNLPGIAPAQGELVEFEERWTGGYIFENEWQSFRTRQNRALELTTAPHIYTRPGRYTVAVKVIDIFGNDTMTLVPVSVG